MGSPTRTATWRDEGINALLKGVGAAAHSAVWCQRVLLEFRMAFGVGAPETRTWRE